MTALARIRAAAPGPLPDEVYATVATAHASPGRAYHTIEHVAEVAGWFAAVARDPGWQRPDEVFAAVLFHDAVYVPGAGDNETRSAMLARQSLPPGVDVSRVVELIELTARHGKLAPGDVDSDAALFLDCDMAIVGAEPAAFDAYDAGIAAEHPHVPAELYRAGRRAFLEGLLARERIFLSEHFHARLDTAARANLRRALARLSAG